MNFKYRVFWTIWSFGWYRIKFQSGKTMEGKIFVGPVVLTWWK